MWFMASMNPSPIISPHQSAAFGKEGMPFSQAMVSLTKQEYIQLKWDGRYWKRQHDRAVAREAALKQELERAQAEIRDLKQRLYGKRSEKGATASEALPGGEKPPRPRGQAPGGKGHGRTARPLLPVVEEMRTLPPEDRACPCCKLPFAPFPGTEDSEIVEIQVGAYVRKVRRERYRKACQCPGVPGVVAAPPAPRPVPKCGQGVSVWVEVLLGKYLHSIPTNRLCADLESLGAPIAPGTLAGGLQKLLPLFEPLRDALLEKHLAERLFHGDETRWKVFEAVEGKVGHRWFPWLTRSASAVCFWMAPGRGADVPKQHMAGLDREALVIFVCDRYSAYPCWAKDYPMVLLAFCWAHVRRDFLDGAKARPELAAWMHAWVESIGELYHLNSRRLEVWDGALPLDRQSPAFQSRHQALTGRLAAMAAKRDLCLGDATLHSARRKVLDSLKNHWPGLTVFADHPQTPMDNNKAENSHRNPVTGRKNYYGSGAVWSAELAAMLFSILQTVILWGLNPRHWLHAFLTACAENGGQPLADLSPFLPWEMGEARRDALKRPMKTAFPPQPNAPAAHDTS
jgi:transposase